MKIRQLKTILILALSVFLLSSGQTSAGEHFSGEIKAVDPASGEELEAYDKLYMHIVYESETQVRFQVVPMRNGLELEYGIMASSTMLWPAGKQDALGWFSFSSATRVDEVQVVVLGTDWSKIDQFGIKLDTVWTSTPVEEPREPVEWVKKLIRKNRLRQEFAFDPNPQQEEVVYDGYFYFSLVLIPFYLILQIQFLRHWRGRWRELAAIPIISVTPMIFMAFLGLGIELRLWVIFIFRGIPFALVYLIALWLVRRANLEDQSPENKDA
jgi:hypothetical protein